MKAPTEFYAVHTYSDRTGTWGPMADHLADREDAVQIVRDYRDTFAKWQVVRVNVASGTSKDVTDAICAEAADDSDDCHSYEAQYREARAAGHFA